MTPMNPMPPLAAAPLTDSEYLLSLIDETFAMGHPAVTAHHERMRAIARKIAETPLVQEAEPVAPGGRRPWWMTRDVNEHDWPGDFNGENGCYECACIHCGATFFGYKRRVTCKACEPSINSALKPIGAVLNEATGRATGVQATEVASACGSKTEFHEPQTGLSSMDEPQEVASPVPYTFNPKVALAHEMDNEFINSRLYKAVDLLQEEDAQPVAWRCFHCNESFTDASAAREHFGDGERQQALCTIDPTHFRWMEEQHRRNCEDDTETLRTIRGLAGEHEELRRSAEELGYSRGLRDANKHPEEIGLVAAPEPGLGPWRVGEFISSARRPAHVLMLAVGVSQIAAYGVHPDFIRWVSA